MHGTRAARGFPFAEATMFQPRTGIIHKFSTLAAQSSVAFLVTAVETYHLLGGTFLLFYAVHVSLKFMFFAVHISRNSSSFAVRIF